MKTPGIPRLAILAGHHLKNSDPTIRGRAAVALATVAPKDDKVVDALIECLKQDPDVAVRSQASLALGMIGTRAKKAIPVLREAVGHRETNLELIRSLVTALGKMGPEAGVAAPDLKKISERVTDEPTRTIISDVLKRFVDNESQ